MNAIGTHYPSAIEFNNRLKDNDSIWKFPKKVHKMLDIESSRSRHSSAKIVLLEQERFTTSEDESNNSKDGYMLGASIKQISSRRMSSKSEIKSKRKSSAEQLSD